VDLGKCLDQAATGPYGGSGAKREENRAREKKRTGSVTGTSTVKNTDVLGLGFIPNQHKQERPSSI
jgi:hypothetical protein